MPGTRRVSENDVARSDASGAWHRPLGQGPELSRDGVGVAREDIRDGLRVVEAKQRLRDHETALGEARRPGGQADGRLELCHLVVRQ